MWYLQFHLVCAKLLLILFCSCILMSSDCVLFLWLAGRFYFNTIGVFCLVHRLTFFEPRHYGGVFDTQQKPPWGIKTPRRKNIQKYCAFPVDGEHRSDIPTGGSFKASLWHTGKHRLALLYPYPDAVRDRPLHKTLISTLLTETCLPCAPPRGTFSPAVADCWYRAPLSPRLAQ